MGELTYTEMVTEIKVEFVNRDDIDTIISNAIHAAYQDIATVFHQYELERAATTTLTIGARRYTLPSDLRVILAVKNQTTGTRLSKVDWRVLDEVATYPTDSPTRYARFGSWIEFDSTPDAADTMLIRYAALVTRLSGLLTSSLASEWDEGIVLGAIYRIHQRLKEFEEAETAKNRYLEFAASRTRPKDLEDEDVDEPLGVRIG